MGKPVSQGSLSSHHPYLPPLPITLLELLWHLRLKDVILPLITSCHKTEAKCLVWVVLFPQLIRKFLEDKRL